MTTEFDPNLSWQLRIEEAQSNILIDADNLQQLKRNSPDLISLSDLAYQYDFALHRVLAEKEEILGTKHVDHKNIGTRLPVTEERLLDTYDVTDSIFESRFGYDDGGILYQAIGGIDSKTGEASREAAEKLKDQIIDLAYSYFSSSEKDRKQKGEEVRKWYDKLLHDKDTLRNLGLRLLTFSENDFWNQFSNDRPFTADKKQIARRQRNLKQNEDLEEAPGGNAHYSELARNYIAYSEGDLDDTARDIKKILSESSPEKAETNIDLTPLGYLSQLGKDDVNVTPTSQVVTINPPQDIPVRPIDVEFVSLPQQGSEKRNKDIVPSTTVDEALANEKLGEEATVGAQMDDLQTGVASNNLSPLTNEVKQIEVQLSDSESTPEEREDAFAWLEKLAAKQGATEGILENSPQNQTYDEVMQGIQPAQQLDLDAEEIVRPAEKPIQDLTEIEIGDRLDLPELYKKMAERLQTENGVKIRLNEENTGLLFKQIMKEDGRMENSLHSDIRKVSIQIDATGMVQIDTGNLLGGLKANSIISNTTEIGSVNGNNRVIKKLEFQDMEIKPMGLTRIAQKSVPEEAESIYSGDTFDSLLRQQLKEKLQEGGVDIDMSLIDIYLQEGELILDIRKYPEKRGSLRDDLKPDTTSMGYRQERILDEDLDPDELDILPAKGRAFTPRLQPTSSQDFLRRIINESKSEIQEPGESLSSDEELTWSDDYQSELRELLKNLIGGIPEDELERMWDNEKDKLLPQELAFQYNERARQLLNAKLHENKNQMSEFELKMRNRLEMVLFIFDQSVKSDMARYFGEPPEGIGKKRDLYERKRQELAKFAIQSYQTETNMKDLQNELSKWMAETKKDLI